MHQKPARRIYLSSPHMGEEEHAYIREVFDSNWIAPLGPQVDAFEHDLAVYTGVAHVAALSSGTAAIHLSLILLGVKPGDLVICQSLTFAASAKPVRYLGAHPVFVDSEPQTWNMCPDALERAIVACMNGEVLVPGKIGRRVRRGRKPKAIIPVHLYGVPAQMDRIMEVAGRYGIPVVEDAAEALGAHIGGKMCGSFGLLGVLSFNGNKIITTSGGGALLSDDGALIRAAHHLATQARDSAPHYEHSQIGYNYRLSNVLAGIGRGQMKVLPERIRQRHAVHAFYRQLLGGREGISFQESLDGAFPNRWLTTILVDPERSGGVTREGIRLGLEAARIEARPIWKPMHLQPVFRGSPYFSHAPGQDCSALLFEQGLCLPSGSNLTGEDLDRIASALKLIIP